MLRRQPQLLAIAGQKQIGDFRRAQTVGDADAGLAPRLTSRSAKSGGLRSIMSSACSTVLAVVTVVTPDALSMSSALEGDEQVVLDQQRRSTLV